MLVEKTNHIILIIKQRIFYESIKYGYEKTLNINIMVHIIKIKSIKFSIFSISFIN